MHSSARPSHSAHTRFYSWYNVAALVWPKAYSRAVIQAALDRLTSVELPGSSSQTGFSSEALRMTVLRLEFNDENGLRKGYFSKS